MNDRTVPDILDRLCETGETPHKRVRSAADLMNTEVRTLTLDHSVKACLQFMDVHRVRHVAVVDHPHGPDGPCEFVGVVSQRDVLRTGQPGGRGPGEANPDPRALRQLLTQVVARRPHSVAPDSPVAQVLGMMLQHHIDMVPVLAEAGLVGLITTTDVLRLLVRMAETADYLCRHRTKQADLKVWQKQGDPDEQAIATFALAPIRQVMASPAIVLQRNDSLGAAKELLQKHRFRHVPIVDSQGQLAGMVSDRDVLRHLPFAGRRPLVEPRGFRGHLFKVKGRVANLALPVEDVMAKRVAVVSPDASIVEAAKTLLAKRVSSLPVLDESRHVCGIVTVTDVIHFLLGVYEPGTVPQKAVAAEDQAGQD